MAIMETEKVDRRLETGIIVIERVNDKYLARHKFNSITDIATNGIELQVNDMSNGKFLWNKDSSHYKITPKSGYLYDHGD